MEETSIQLSVIVLAYMAQETLVSFVDQLHREISALHVTFEIIIVANYEEISLPDNTPKVAQQLAETYRQVKVISKVKSGKMGWDMKTGLAAATGNYLAVIDGDGQMPSSDIPTVYKIMATGDFDLVKTFRAKRFDGLWRLMLSKIYNLLFSLLYRTDFPVNDINSKPKIFARSTYLKMNLRSNDWFTDAEIMLEANRLKLRVCQVATVFYKNERRTSFVNTGTIFEFIVNLIKYKQYY